MTLTNIDLNPIEIINDYVWALLRQEINIEKIGTIAPISVSDGPELKEGKKPYLVYGYSHENSGSLAPLVTITGSYAVYAPSFSKVNEIVNLIVRAFDDERSASNVLDWTNKPSNPKSLLLKGINLASLEALGSEGAMPSTEEGGMAEGYVMFRYRYTTPDKNFSINL